jgi:hypothetical protein
VEEEEFLHLFYFITDKLRFLYAAPSPPSSLQYRGESPYRGRRNPLIPLRLVLTARPHPSDIFSPCAPRKKNPSWAGPLGSLRAARCQSSFFLKMVYRENELETLNLVLF